MNKIKKKRKFERTCYNCKYLYECANRYRINTAACDKFKFCASCKSI